MAATTEGWAMNKKYFVRLTAAERATVDQIVRKLKGSSQKVRRANILLKAGAGGPAWAGARIAGADGCRRQTGEQLREAVGAEGVQSAREGPKREPPPQVPHRTPAAKDI